MTDTNNILQVNNASKEQIIQKIIEIIHIKLGIDSTTISPESRLIEDLGADSLDLVELVMDVEEKFNIIIPDADASKLFTVMNIADYIMKTQK